MEEYEAATDEAPTESCQSGQAAERKMQATAAHRKSRVSWEMGARAKGSRASARKRPLKNSTRCQTCRSISAPGEASCWHEAALLLQEPPRECRRCNVSFRGETMVAGMMSAGETWSRGWSLQCMHCGVNRLAVVAPCGHPRGLWPQATSSTSSSATTVTTTLPRRRLLLLLLLLVTSADRYKCRLSNHLDKRKHYVRPSIS